MLVQSRLLGVYEQFNARNNISNISPFLIVGYTDIELEAESAKASDSSFSYGVGFEYQISELFYLDFEYITYYDEGATNFNGVSLGLNILLDR